MTGVRYKRGESDERPWGRWEVLEVGERFTVKRITVKPGQTLSLQLHHHREEHWVVVKGQARVTVGEAVVDKGPNEHIFIPIETKHRIANPTDADVEFIEVQYGETLDENDIVRLEDTYGRA